jgi:NAD(P)-dependent dehydrogenase (short-subunit alcohol dehydrogenase family)
MFFRNWRWLGMGKCNSKMGVENETQQTILLIGGSGGIGSALIQSDLFNSNIVCVPTYFSNKPIDGELPWRHYDSGDLSSAESVIEKLSGECNIDMIIDASGAFFASTIEKTSLNTIRDVAWTNFLAPLALTKIALKYLAPSGKIVFLSSVTTQLNVYGSSVYAASKSGLEKTIVLLGPEYEKSGKAICGIRLGYMDYGMTYQINEGTRNLIKNSLPKGEFLTIDELADLLLKLFYSDYASVTGKIYDIGIK